MKSRYSFKRIVNDNPIQICNQNEERVTSTKLSKEAGRTEPMHAGQMVHLFVMCALFLAFFLFSFSIGRYGVPVKEVIRILFHKLIPIRQTWTSEMETVVINIRLPRIVMASFVGCALSTAGASYQGVFQNPMASPDILGASSGQRLARLWRSCLRFNPNHYACRVFVELGDGHGGISHRRACAGLRVVNLILAGIMVGSLFTAGTSYIKLVADPSNQLPAITYWMMGSLSGSKLAQVVFVAVPMALGMIPLLLIRWQINILTLGDDEARTLGVNTNRLRLIVILCATLITAASVSVSGMIGWVGLVIPHLSRKLVGNNYRYLLPASMILGATFLLIVDNVSRNLLAVEIPIGILTAFIGAPFFIYLIAKQEKTI